MSSAEIWIEAAAFIAAVLLIPFYMGFIHVARPGPWPMRGWAE